MSKLYTVLAVASDDRWDHMDGWGGGWMWLWGIAMMALFVVPERSSPSAPHGAH